MLTLFENFDLTANPSLSSMHDLVIRFRNQTKALLDEPRVWGGVERMAKALVRRRHLSARDVEKVLGGNYLRGQRPGFHCQT